MEQTSEKKKRNVPSTRKQHGWYSPDKKAECVTAYLALGNANLVEALTKVPAGTIRAWKTEQWWKDLEAGIRDEENLQLDVRLTKVVGKTLDLLEDRLENGDYMYDPKAGQLIRKPLNADIINKITTDSFDRRKILRGERKEEEVNNIQIGDHLLKLAEQFVRIAKSQREVNTIDAEVIYAGPIRSNEKQIRSDYGNESSQNQGSQDLQCNEEKGGRETSLRQEEINEMPDLSADRRLESQSTSSTENQEQNRRVVGEGYSDQDITRSIPGRNEDNSSSRMHPCSSRCNGVETKRSDSIENRETGIYFTPE